MVLKIEYVDRIRKDDDLLLTLAKANNVRVGSAERWCLRGNKKGNRILTTASNLVIISKHFGISETADLLEEEYVEGNKYPERAQN